MSPDRRLRLASLVSELHCLCCYLNLFLLLQTLIGAGQFVRHWRAIP